jgi:hypothetical protein
MTAPTDPIREALKTCTGCKKEKVAMAFYRSCARCKDCFRAYEQRCSRERKDVTADQVRAAFDYDSDAGALRWKLTQSGAVAGQIAGHVHANGYHRVGWRGTSFPLHRLIWLHVRGSPLPEEVDHINGNPLDNHIENLRAATRKTNALNLKTFSNNTSGAKGVYLHKRSKKWIARIQRDGKDVILGAFTEFSLAVAKRKEAELEIYGEFANDR